MSEIAPISAGAALQGPARETAAPEEPRLPMGRQLSSVQPHPTPLVAAVETPQPVADESARTEHVARVRAEMNGTGSIIDRVG